MFIATLNRTPKILSTIIGRIFLEMATIGTHDWNKFITKELIEICENNF